MSADEFSDRVRQHLGARVDGVRYRAGLGFPQTFVEAGQAGSFFFSSEQVPAICRALETRIPQQVRAIVERAERICQHKFDLLGYTDLDYGAEIDWHLDAVHGKRAPFKPFHRIHYLDFNEVGDSKITWELNRHQHLVTLAKGYRFTGNAKFATELFQQWKHWHAHNPYPMGTNWSSALEVAFRSLSWLWVYYLLAGSSVAPEWFQQEWIEALAVSGRHLERYLSTYFSPNTHLLGEGVALFLIGTLCPQIEAAGRWRERGWQIVVDEAKRQVRADGLHFEQSLYYHVYALDFFLHARILASLNQREIPGEFDRTLVKMMDTLALLAVTAPTGFSDDDGGRLFDPQRNRTAHFFDPLATGAILFGRGEWKKLAGDVREETVWLLGPEAIEKFDRLASTEPRRQSTALKVSGLYVMRDANAHDLIIDAGPQGTASAGHGHADALSVCVSQGGQPLLIDSGTYEYVGDGPERNQFRGTGAHNTLAIDDVDQAIPTGPFSWTNLPNVLVDHWITGQTFDFFAGHHDGYRRLAEPVIHRRDVFFLKGKFWLVRDIADGKGRHKLQLSWHLPGEFKKTERTLIANDGRSIGILGLAEHDWDETTEPGVWSPAYGYKEAGSSLSFTTTAELPARFATLLAPGVGGSQETGVLSRLSGASAGDAYRYKTKAEEYFLMFNPGKQPWTAGPCRSDAELLCFGLQADGRRVLIFCNGSRVEIAGKPVVTCARMVERCELVGEAGNSELYCSDQSGVTVHESLDHIALEPGAGNMPDSLIGPKKGR